MNEVQIELIRRTRDKSIDKLHTLLLTRDELNDELLTVCKQIDTTQDYIDSLNDFDAVVSLPETPTKENN